MSQAGFCWVCGVGRILAGLVAGFEGLAFNLRNGLWVGCGWSGKKSITHRCPIYYKTTNCAE